MVNEMNNLNNEQSSTTITTIRMPSRLRKHSFVHGLKFQKEKQSEIKKIFTRSRKSL